MCVCIGSCRMMARHCHATWPLHRNMFDCVRTVCCCCNASSPSTSSLQLHQYLGHSSQLSCLCSRILVQLLDGSHCPCNETTITWATAGMCKQNVIYTQTHTEIRYKICKIIKYKNKWNTLCIRIHDCTRYNSDDINMQAVSFHPPNIWKSVSEFV